MRACQNSVRGRIAQWSKSIICMTVINIIQGVEKGLVVFLTESATLVFHTGPMQFWRGPINSRLR